MIRKLTLVAAFVAVAAVALLSSACGGDDGEVLTIYAGRSQNLVNPLLEQFSKDTGIKIRVRYGDGTDLALGILEEGDKTPADIYYGQDVGALGALKNEGMLLKIDDATLNKVDPAFRSPDGLWVGTSGRARVIVYNTDDIDPKTLPSTILDYTKPEWKGRVGIVPRSDGFPEFVTALRFTKGEAFAKQWLTDLNNNNVRTFPNNIAALQAVANDEIDVAFLNHYYLYRFLAERGEGYKARNYYFTNGDIGGLFLVSGVAIIKHTKNEEAAQKFADYMLSEYAQNFLAQNDHEYPLVKGIAADPALPDLSSIEPPEIDLSDLNDLKGSLELMRQAGILP
ncbi:MAG: iron ABC transporter substrate-binding protein [Dehalococcoidia bacterium]